MLTSEQIKRCTPKLWIIQLTAAAILFGAILFAVMVAILVNWNDVTGEVKIMTMLGVATGFSMFALSWIVPHLIDNSATQVAAQLISEKDQPDLDEKIIAASLESLASSRIVMMAILEGAIFLNLVTFMIEHSLAALIAVVIGFGIMLLRFPRKPARLEWLDERLKAVKQEMELIR